MRDGNAPVDSPVVRVRVGVRVRVRVRGSVRVRGKGRGRVRVRVVQQPPLVRPLYDGVVGCPADHWLEQHALVGVRAVRGGSGGVGDEVRVSRRV